MPAIVDFPTVAQDALAVFGDEFDTETARRHFVVPSQGSFSPTTFEWYPTLTVDRGLSHAATFDHPRKAGHTAVDRVL